MFMAFLGLLTTVDCRIGSLEMIPENFIILVGS